MKKKQLYPKITEMPYYSTRVSKERTKAEIVTLLEKNGVESHSWTRHEGKDLLQFIVKFVVQGTEIHKEVKLELPVIKARKYERGHYRVIEVPERHALRLVYHSLKGLLESTKYGLVRLEHVFFSYTLTQLPTGEIVQVKDLLEKHPLLLQSGIITEVE